MSESKNKITVVGNYSSEGNEYAKVKYGDQQKSFSIDTNKWVGAEFNKNNFSAGIGYNTKTKDKGIKVKWTF